jgi:molybdate transport system substrate-binding protein
MTAAIQGISSMATRGLLAELAAAYERQCGVAVRVESVGGVDAAQRVQAGEPFDFVVLPSEAIDKLAARKFVVARSKLDVAQSGVAIAVRRGDVKPDISSEDAVKRTVLSAARVGYSAGPSGVAVVTLLERWDIAAEIADRLVQAPPGIPVGSLVARGEKSVKSLPRSFIRRSWLASIDSRSSSSLIFRSDAFGITDRSLMPAICWLRQSSSALGAVV